MSATSSIAQGMEFGLQSDDLTSKCEDKPFWIQNHRGEMVKDDILGTKRQL